MEQFSQSGSRGRRRTGNEPAPHERVKGERRANEPRRTASPHRASANNAGRANTPAAEQTPARPKSRYIPALDGLRTLAVVAVVLYHLNLTWAQGGLLGVTIFFVLSGYLITRLLLNEDRTQRPQELLDSPHPSPGPRRGNGSVCNLRAVHYL